MNITKLLSILCYFWKISNIFANRTGLETLDHYLDDLFSAGQDSTNDCQMLMSAFQELCVELGIPLAEDKRNGPTTTIMFLCLEIDTVLMLVRL
jgi:hypothetical protein